MARLWNQSQNVVILSNLQTAQGYWQRLIGLLGHSELDASEGLWFKNCSSIHTLGMRFAIDCIFIDKEMKVKSLKSNIKPFRWTLPVWGADSVIEARAGLIESTGLSIGDQLHVGH